MLKRENINRIAFPKLSLLGKELGLALLVKLILLVGLWLMIFHWQDHPATKPDIAEHFSLSMTSLPLGLSFQRTYGVSL